jgi:RNA polymerase sigma-70 factor (family 1)
VPFDGLHNEKELLTQVSQGDRDAFRVLYTTCYPHVRRFISLFESSARMQDELAQDVFVRIWEKRARLTGVETLKAYLFTVTKHVVLNFIRALKVRRRIKELDETMDGGDNDLENELLFKQYYEIAIQAMEKLPPGRRKVLKMSIDGGLTLDEIAAQLGISRSGVKKQLYAATAFVRQYLQEHGAP